MSNRKKIKGRLFSKKALTEIDIPVPEKVVLKTVPAVIHYKDIPDNPREDSEVVGQTIIYEDGTLDIIVFDEITEESHEIIYSLKSHMFSVEGEGPNGSPEQE